MYTSSYDKTNYFRLRITLLTFNTCILEMQVPHALELVQVNNFLNQYQGLGYTNTLIASHSHISIRGNLNNAFQVLVCTNCMSPQLKREVDLMSQYGVPER